MQEPRGVSLEAGYSTDLSVPAPAEEEQITGLENCTSSTTGRGTDREHRKEGASVGGTDRRSARTAQPGNPREPGFFWRSLEIPRYQVNASHTFSDYRK